MRVDSSTWTGLPSHVRPAAGPWGDMMTEAQDAAMCRDLMRYDRLQRWRALRMLWGPAIRNRAKDSRKGWTVYDGHVRHRGDDWTLWRAVRSSVAILANRMHGQAQIDRHRSRTGKLYIPSHDMGHWDSHSDGYGYSSMCLQLYPACRIEIFSDGESFM